MKKLCFSLIALCGLVMCANAQVEFSFDANTKTVTEGTFVSEDGLVTINNLAGSAGNRNVSPYVSGYKAGSVEVDLSSLNGGTGSSIATATLYMQNGSSSGVMTITTSYYDGSGWVTTEINSVEGNARAVYTPTTLVSKSKVQKIRFAFSNSSWLCAVKVIESAVADGAPAFLSAYPTAGTNLPAEGDITLKFDELMKSVVTTAVSLGNATITAVRNLGNTLKISYNSLTSPATPVLAIAKENVTDLGDTPLAVDISIAYAIDVTPPAIQNIVPADGSTIHINDLGEEARKIKLTFDEPIKIDPSKTVIFGTAGIVNASVSGNVLTLSYSNLPYNAINTLTIPAGFVTDLSDNEWVGNVYSYTTGLRDNTAPVLTSSLPSGTKPIGGSFSFTFDEIIQVANQTATVNGQPAVLSNSGRVIGLNYTNMPYGTSIAVEIPASAVADTCGNAIAQAIAFSFDTETKVAKAFDIVVPNDYATIQEAINSITDDTKRTLIYVKAGTYIEKLAVWKNNVSLIGESRDNVIISWNECSSTSTLQPQYSTGINSAGTDASYTMLIKGNNFYGENFTVRNDYNHAGGSEANKQAVAIEHISGDKHVLKNVKMFSFQDTYYPKSANIRQYLLNPYIIGGTDFIFGSGTCFIEGGTIDCYEGGQYITAASDTQKEFGIVINNTEVKYAGLTSIGTKRQFNLGRPWKVPAKTAFLNSTFENGLITPAGWAEWSGTENHLSADYGTYNNTNLNTDGFVSWSKQLTAAEATRYNFDNAFNYGENNVWNPLPYTTAPEAVSGTVGSELSWVASTFAVGYLVYDNGELIGSTIETTYPASDTAIPHNYEVAPYNAYGAVGEKAVLTNDTGIHSPNVKQGFLKNTVAESVIEFENADELASISIIVPSGQVVKTAKITAPTLNISGLSQGIYLIKGIGKSGEVYTAKFLKK